MLTENLIGLTIKKAYEENHKGSHSRGRFRNPLSTPDKSNAQRDASIVDKPVIQYVVEEAVESGIEDVIIVTGYVKRAIEDHFDVPNAELIKNLESAGKQDLVRHVM